MLVSPLCSVQGKWGQMSPAAVPTLGMCGREGLRGDTQVPERVSLGLPWLAINPKSYSSQPTNFTLVFSDLHVYASMFSVVLMNYIFMDGKCDYFQGDHLPQGCCGTWHIPISPGMGCPDSNPGISCFLGLLVCGDLSDPGVLVDHLGVVLLQQFQGGDYSHFPL